MNDHVKHRRTNGILFAWLLLAGLLGSLIGVPYTIAVLMDPAAGGPVDPQAVWLSALAEAVFFLAPATAVGVWLGRKVGLGPRLLRQLMTNVPERWRQVRSHLQASLVVGFTLGVFGFVQYLVPEGAFGPGLDNPTTFEYFLRCLSAGLTEEIFFRLGLLTFFVWVIRSIVRKSTIHVPSLWVGNVLAALAFAGAHLPHVLTFGTLGWSLLIPIIVGSSFAGIVMGWLYMRYGLISAIVAHFIVDFVVYVVPRLLAVIA